MKISLNWLKRYIDIDVPVQELCDRMVMAGFEVEEIIDLGASLTNTVAARILSLEKHPEADRLQICRVDTGKEEPVQIVTGATNVYAGALVPAALNGARLPNGMAIKTGKLRGQLSEGMLCSGGELQIKESDYPGAEADGILILADDIPVGTDMRELLGLNDTVIDFSVTANRPDCQSVIGIAREAAVALGVTCRLPQPCGPDGPVYPAAGGDISEYIRVEVRDGDLCPRYMGRVVKNLRVAPSPEWMKQCLKAAGMRPINNIVDITNFVMLETGQPMHAFDMRDIRKAQIIVRRAGDGEQMTTLDGKEHRLTGEMLVIADG
ncbi:MAG: phenylalanine--tRNA ligase subunit beta, partial [Oscillospiraceae bacterium]|nr:phenylalanine--tRNA ligase subunit beta [Oscillospiraceae bacterium]